MNVMKDLFYILLVVALIVGVLGVVYLVLIAPNEGANELCKAAGYDYGQTATRGGVLCTTETLYYFENEEQIEPAEGE